MDYEKKYKDALERARKIHNDTEFDYEKGMMEEVFPELAESENERIRKKLIDTFKFYDQAMNSPFLLGILRKDILAWLEKRGEQDSYKYYIRLGNIPSNEKSKIYRNEEEIGIEEGVSVYPAFETNGDIVIGLSLPITQTTLHTQQHLLEYENRPCYLVTGDYVGKGSDGEPLIKNVRIVKEINPYRIKQDKENEEIPKWLEKQGEQKPTTLKPIKGNYYTCIRDYVFCEHDDATYKKGKIYKSEEDETITADDGGKWPFSDAKDFFRLATEEELLQAGKSNKFSNNDWVVCEHNNIIGEPMQYKELETVRKYF